MENVSGINKGQGKIKDRILSEIRTLLTRSFTTYIVLFQNQNLKKSR